jgi:AcrR family transcriptional regulator
MRSLPPRGQAGNLPGETATVGRRWPRVSWDCPPSQPDSSNPPTPELVPLVRQRCQPQPSQPVRIAYHLDGGVSENTVFNYFPTKESLILDRLESTMAALRTGLAEPGVSPVQAALRILDGELGAMTSWLATQDDPVQASAMIQRFGALIQATPSLRAHQSDLMDQFVAIAAAILAERAGMSPDDPESQITATALLGLWRIQFRGLRRYLDGARTPAQVHQAMTADVHRAAQLIDTGLSSFAAAPR